MENGDVVNVLKEYTLAVYCGICEERRGFVKHGSNKVDMICDRCRHRADKEIQKKVKKDAKEN